MITVERASHTDLYDQVNVIPFEEMDRFIKGDLSVCLIIITVPLVRPLPKIF